jgi:hypothetical protein
MICDVPDPETTPARQQVTAHRPERQIRWWSRPSPWLWGLVILLAMAAIAATQVPRVFSMLSTRPPTPGPAVPTVVPTLSGQAYTQAMVGERSFIGADLRGARLMHLDLRGRSFQRADAAGAVFTGSFINGANFSHADLRGADLRDTCLRGAIFAHAALAGADFTGADVTGAVVTPSATSKAIGWASLSTASVCPQG